MVIEKLQTIETIFPKLELRVWSRLMASFPRLLHYISHEMINASSHLGHQEVLFLGMGIEEEGGLEPTSVTTPTSFTTSGFLLQTTRVRRPEGSDCNLDCVAAHVTLVAAIIFWCSFRLADIIFPMQKRERLELNYKYAQIIYKVQRVRKWYLNKPRGLLSHPTSP